MGEFQAAVDAWIAKVPRRLKAVRDYAAQEVVKEANTPTGKGGRMRVDTNFLRASCTAVVGTTPPPVTFKPKDNDGPFEWDAGAVNLVIVNAPLGEVITIAWTANYARARHYGANGQPGDHWASMAAQNWQRHVANGAALARAGRFD